MRFVNSLNIGIYFLYYLFMSFRPCNLLQNQLQYLPGIMATGCAFLTNQTFKMSRLTPKYFTLICKLTTKPTMKKKKPLFFDMIFSLNYLKLASDIISQQHFFLNRSNALYALLKRTYFCHFIILSFGHIRMCFLT